jgi:ParB-like chromosome segregation protein Spo0J
METRFDEAAIAPKRGKVKPIDIISLERRKIDEDTVAELVEVLARDRCFLHPIAVRDEGPNGYRLIAGGNRLEAWKRHFGEQQPIQAVILPSHASDARITALETGENVIRKELSPAERQAEMMRLAAALKELEARNWQPSCQFRVRTRDRQARAGAGRKRRRRRWLPGSA